MNPPFFLAMPSPRFVGREPAIIADKNGVRRGRISRIDFVWGNEGDIL
jgi:hypothetical protein